MMTSEEGRAPTRRQLVIGAAVVGVFLWFAFTKAGRALKRDLLRNGS